jgi:hypothetical protein
MPNEPTQGAPLIGQFKGPQQNAARLPRKDAPSENPADDAKLKETMEVIDKEIIEPLVKEGTPAGEAETYEGGLASVGLTLAQARAIMEEILLNNYYKETCHIQSLPVILRTRSYYDTVRLHRFMTAENPVYQASIQDIIARHNLAASLAQYGDRIFDFPDDEKEAEKAFDVRMKFVETRNALIVGRLMKLVYDFDHKMEKVFADGAPQDF